MRSRWLVFFVLSTMIAVQAEESTDEKRTFADYLRFMPGKQAKLCSGFPCDSFSRKKPESIDLWEKLESKEFCVVPEQVVAMHFSDPWERSPFGAVWSEDHVPNAFVMATSKFKVKDSQGQVHELNFQIAQSSFEFPGLLSFQGAFSEKTITKGAQGLYDIVGSFTIKPACAILGAKDPVGELMSDWQTAAEQRNLQQPHIEARELVVKQLEPFKTQLQQYGCDSQPLKFQLEGDPLPDHQN